MGHRQGCGRKHKYMGYKQDLWGDGVHLQQLEEKQPSVMKGFMDWVEGVWNRINFGVEELFSKDNDKFKEEWICSRGIHWSWELCFSILNRNEGGISWGWVCKKDIGLEKKDND